MRYFKKLNNKSRIQMNGRIKNKKIKENFELNLIEFGIGI